MAARQNALPTIYDDDYFSLSDSPIWYLATILYDAHALRILFLLIYIALYILRHYFRLPCAWLYVASPRARRRRAQPMPHLMLIHALAAYWYSQRFRRKMGEVFVRITFRLSPFDLADSSPARQSAYSHFSLFISARVGTLALRLYMMAWWSVDWGTPGPGGRFRMATTSHAEGFRITGDIYFTAICSLAKKSQSRWFQVSGIL